jgi:tetraacyldisaccharide 4'-kinase
MNSPSSFFFPPLGAMYAALSQARVSAYEGGWLPVAKLPAPVISVGNLTVGGTGKTPLVQWISRVIADQTNERVCILTRGYQRADSRSQVLVSDGEQILVDAVQAGDEPYLLAKSLLGKSAVVCNADRFSAGKWAIANLGSEVFVLDDGFQHLQLARDLDVVVIDATNPWGGGRIVPAGRLREKPKGLRRADCVVITRADQVDNLQPLISEIHQLTGANVPVFVSRMATSRYCDLEGNGISKLNLHSTSARTAAFCGIGNPESFLAHLKRDDLQPVFTKTFADHHHYTQLDIDQLTSQAKQTGATHLITTAKDATKLSEFNFELECVVLEIHLSIDEAERFTKLISDVARRTV